MNRRGATWIAFVLFFAGFGFAQSQEDALQILNKVAETYRSVKTLQGEIDLTDAISGPGMQQNQKMHLQLTLASPGRMRMENKTGPASMLMISDGQTMWVYMPTLNKYSKFSLDENPSEANRSVPPGLPGFGDIPDFAKIADGVKQAKIVRSEILQLDGVATDCYAIEVVRQGAVQQAAAQTAGQVEAENATFWVDKARLLVVRLSTKSKVTLPGASAPMETKTDVTFSKLTLGDPVPDDAFVFTPPEGATELDLTQFMPKKP